jgi:hemoglobin/transferrin/lactoferrin receptor protein
LIRSNGLRGRKEVEILMMSSPRNPCLANLAIALILSFLTEAPQARAQSTPETSPPSRRSSALADTSRPVLFLEEILITGARYPRAYYESPQALSFISRGQLRERVPTVVGDALAILPGVDNSKDSPWEQRPVLRGLGGQRILVLVDGMPMNSARGNGPHPSLVDPDQIERIEVARGPSSVAYGSDALGGAINIITREAPVMAERFRGSATVSGSSADKQRNAYLELMPRLGRLSAFVSSGFRKAENFRSPGGEVPNSQFSDYNALSNFRYDLGDRTALRLGWQLYRGSDIGIPGLSFEFPGARQEFDFSYYDRDLVHLNFDHAHRSPWLAATRVKLYWQQERRDFYSEQVLDSAAFASFGVPSRSGATSATTLQDRYLDLDTYGFQAQLTSARTSQIRFAAGVDASRDMTDGDNVRRRTYYDADGNPVPGPGGSPATAQRITASLPDGRFDNLGAFAQGEWFLDRRSTLHAGGRYTHYRYRTDFGLNTPASGAPGSQDSYFQPMRVDDNALSGSLGLVHALLPDLHLSANVSNGYRQPNAQDLFFNGPASVGNVLGNQNLDPERSVSYDAGLRWGPGRLGLAANLFYSTYEDLIDALPVPGPPGPPTYQYTNISAARIWGWEAEFEWRFMPRWSARGAVSDATGDITSAKAIRTIYGVGGVDQAPLSGVPPIRGSFTLRWSDAQSRFWVEPGARWSWRTSRLPLPTPGVPEFTEFKPEWIVGDLLLGASLPWGQRLVLGVRNITDTPYRQALASVDDPGISVVGSLATDF